MSFQRALCPETKSVKGVNFYQLGNDASIYAERLFLANLLHFAIIFRQQTQQWGK